MSAFEIWLLGFVCGFSPLAVIGLLNETRLYRRMRSGA